MRIFEPFRSFDVGEPSNESATPSPREILGHAKACLDTLVHLHYLRHGFEHWDNMFSILLASVGFTFLNELLHGAFTSRDDKAALSTVVLCAKGLQEQARCCYLAEAFFLLLRDNMTPETRCIVKEVADIEHEEERKQVLARHIHSSWPVNIVSINDDPEQKSLDAMIRSYVCSSTNDTSKSSDSSSCSRSGITQESTMTLDLHEG